MKIITILVVLQMGILLLLFGKVVGIEDQMKPATPGEKNTLVIDDLAVTRAQRYSNDANWYPNEDRLRQIIREELGAQQESRSESDAPTESAIASDSRDPAEMEYQRARVAQQLETYVSVGSISDADMQKLQMDIAKLDAAGRTEMLRKLSRAFNSGNLEGRL